MPRRQLLFVFLAAAITFSLGIVGGVAVIDRSILAHVKIIPPTGPVSLTPAQIQTYAEQITVKVQAGELWGSGILIHRQGSTYVVVTNAHVLRLGDRYTVHTFDNSVYSAQVIQEPELANQDLGLLEFESPEQHYFVAIVGISADLDVGEPVFAVGYPMLALADGSQGLVFSAGRVSLVLDRTFDQGYQVGYTSDVQKGMSGGPVLNQLGEVVAINGVHAYPLWGDPYVFDDGSHPCPPLHRLMTRSSWGIAMDHFSQLVPQYVRAEEQSPPLTRSEHLTTSTDPIKRVNQWVQQIGWHHTAARNEIQNLKSEAESAQSCQE